MKSYTNIEQSKKLAEILPLESADMHYNDWTYDFYDGYEHTGIYLVDLGIPQTICGELDIPCWSLAALLDVLPKQFGRYTKSLGWFDDAWHCVYMDEDSECKYCVSADNPLDACYEMILKLQELKNK